MGRFPDWIPATHYSRVEDAQMNDLPHDLLRIHQKT
jgi:hypothetical protein